MEFRWLTPDEQRSRVVESGSLAEVLALAQQLQAEGDARFGDEQVVEMGRELGIQPQYIREALHLRRAAQQPARSAHTEVEAVHATPSPMGALGRALSVGFGLGTLPLALIALANSHDEPIAFFVLIATLVAGWSARSQRVAGIAGAITAPLVILVSAMFINHPGLDPGAFFLALLSFTPLSAATSRLAARLRARLEHMAEPPRLPVSGH